MEYEIEEEGELLDDSNNPSLDHSTRRQSPAKPGDDPRKDRATQKAVLIPEESPKA